MKAVMLRKAATTVGQWVIDALNLADRSSLRSYNINTYTGRPVTPEVAMTFGAVNSCVNLLSKTVASLPIDMMRKQGDQRVAIDHPLEELLDEQPNPDMTAIDFRMTMMAGLCLWGNAYAGIVRREGTGPVIALWPLLPERMQIKRKDNGDLVYGYRKVPTGTIEEYAARDILHIRLLSYDGIYGLSPIAQAREGIAVGLAAEEFAGRFFGQGAQLGVVLQLPETLGPEAAKNIRNSWEAAHSGLDQAHRVAILEEGVTVKTLTMPLKDAEFLETRKLQRAEVASLYQVPPHMIGDVDRSTSWGTGIEQQSIGFVRFTLLPLLAIWEQALRRCLLTDAERAQKIYFKLNTAALLRAELKARYEAHAIGITNGIINRNEARSHEDLPPYEGGEGYMTPLNMAIDGKPIAEPEPARGTNEDRD